MIRKEKDMQVILIEDVKSLGKKGEIVKVSDGYANNFILKKNLGLEATPKNLNDLKLQKAAEAKRAQEEYEAAQAYAEELATKKIVLSIKVGKNGRTFGSVSGKEIVEEMKKQINVSIDKKKLVLPEPIKTPGIFDIPIKLHQKVTGTIKVEIKEVIADK
jgi:large subunit ribosomal protein L9